jgi:hypothetical protein
MAIVQSIGAAQIGRVEGGAGTMVFLIALIILFGAATYFTGRLYGTAGTVAISAGFVVIVVGLLALGGLGIFG